MIASKASLALVAVAVLALGAGLVGGVLYNRTFNPAMTSVQGSEGETGGSALAHDLGLSNDQRDKMQAIWEGVRTTAHDCQEKAQQLQKKRDDAIFEMLSDEQKAKYTQITTECVGKIGLLNSQREAAFGKAVERTKSMLNDSQKKAYEQMIAARVGQNVSDNQVQASAHQFALQQ